MKIGTLTFHRADNYGALLQSYALYKKLKNLGHEARIVDYRSHEIEKAYYKCKYLPHIDKNILRWCWRLFRNFFIVPKLNKKRKKCHKFRDKYFQMTESVLTKEDRKKVENEFDLILTGSDQIWNPEITGGKDDWYCFKRSDGKAKVAAFAASVGSLQNFKEVFPKYKDDLNKYDAISVRETDIYEFLKENIQAPVVNIIDPVFLLDKKEWDELALCPIKEKYLFYYDVEKNPVSYTLARKIAKEENLLLVHFDSKYFYEKGFMANAGPEEFVGLIRNAEYVVTSSFHATAFSIIYRKKFISAIHPTTGARVRSLLTNLGLENRIVECVEDFKGFSDKFTNVDDCLKSQRKNQEIYLKEVFNLCQTKKN